MWAFPVSAPYKLLLLASIWLRSRLIWTCKWVVAGDRWGAGAEKNRYDVINIKAIHLCCLWGRSCGCGRLLERGWRWSVVGEPSRLCPRHSPFQWPIEHKPAQNVSVDGKLLSVLTRQVGSYRMCIYIFSYHDWVFVFLMFLITWWYETRKWLHDWRLQSEFH